MFLSYPDDLKDRIKIHIDFDTIVGSFANKFTKADIMFALAVASGDDLIKLESKIDRFKQSLNELRGYMKYCFTYQRGEPSYQRVYEESRNAIIDFINDKIGEHLKMICYRDRTFCPFWTECKHGDRCTRALTQGIKDQAQKIGLPVMCFAEKPLECYEEKPLEGEPECTN